MSQIYTVKTKGFEGPLDLLLQLIDTKELSINDISLAKVTEEYIEHINKLTGVSKTDIAQFLVIASTLMLIKSISLLPTLEATKEEEQSIEELETRLRIFNEIREHAEKIQKIYGRSRIFYQSMMPSKIPSFAPHPSITKEILSSSLEEMLTHIPVEPELAEKAIEKVVTLEETIQGLLNRIQKNIKLSFSEFSGHSGKPIEKREKINVILNFLAMLELVKQEVVQVQQDELFNDIVINNT